MKIMGHNGSNSNNRNNRDRINWAAASALKNEIDVFSSIPRAMENEEGKI